MALSDVLKKRLKDRNLAEVSRELGIPRTLLFEWTQARRIPSLKNVHHLKALATYLSLSLDELLLGGTQDKVLSSVTFEDAGKKYRIKIERI